MGVTARQNLAHASCTASSGVVLVVVLTRYESSIVSDVSDQGSDAPFEKRGGPMIIIDPDDDDDRGG